MTIEVVDLTPTGGTNLGQNQQIVLGIRSSDNFGRIVVAFRYPATGVTEMVYSQDPAGPTADVFESPYAASTIEVVASPGWQLFRFTFTRYPGWLSAPALLVFATNVISESLTYVTSWTMDTTSVQTLPMSVVFGTPQASTAIAFDEQHYLEVLRRSYPADYIGSIKRNRNGGYELFQGASAVGARMSLAIARLSESGILMFAKGGQYATGSVDFFRTDVTAGAITLLAGTEVLASKSGRKFVTTTDVVFGATDTGPITADVRAIAYGYQYNLPGEVLTGAGETLPGEIDTIWLLKTPTPQIDPNMQVRQVFPTTGGRAATLDGHGEDREIFRKPQEPDEVYMVRIVDKPDVVSPNAIIRGVNRILFGYGLSGCCFREVGTSLFPGLFFDGDGGANRDDLEFFDVDPSLRPEDRFKLMLDEQHFRGYFTVGLPYLHFPDYGAFFDGADSDAAPIINAFDQTGNAANSSFDAGSELQKVLYDTIDACIAEKHMGGVRWDTYLELIGCF